MYFSTYSLLYSIALYIKLYIITNINMILNLYLCYTTNKTIIFSCCSKNKKLFPLDFDTVLYFIIQTRKEFALWNISLSPRFQKHTKSLPVSCGTMKSLGLSRWRIRRIMLIGCTTKRHCTTYSRSLF